MTSNVAGTGHRRRPVVFLSTPPGKSDFEAWRDEEADPPALVVQVGGTQLRYQLRCIEDLHAMLKERGDWMPLGNADEQKPAADGFGHGGLLPGPGGRIARTEAAGAESRNPAVRYGARAR